MWCWLCLFEENLGIEGKAQKSNFLCFLIKPYHPYLPIPSQGGCCLIHFHGITSERHFYDPVDQAGDSMSALLVLSLPLGPLSVLVYTSAKGVEWYSFLQVNFKGMISFQEVLQDSRRNENAMNSLNFHLCYKVLLLQRTGSTFQGGIQVRVAQACCLEYNVNDRLTAYCQTGNVL